MPLSSGLSIHDDTKHKGSAKRDVASGIAALDGAGSIMSAGPSASFVRDVANQIYIRERTASETALVIKRKGANDFDALLLVAGGGKVLQHSAMKDVADGIAGLDANAKIPYTLLDFNNSRAPLLSGLSIDFSTGSDIFHADDPVNTHNSLTPTKVNEIDLDKTVGSLRVSFDLWSPDGTLFVYGQILRNGAAVGVSRSNNSVTPVNYIEYISGWSDGDLLQLFTQTSNVGYQVSSQNFRILCDISGVQIG